MLEHVRNDASSGATIDTDVGFDPTLSSTPFGSYSCSYDWRGVEVSEQFIGDTLIQEYKEQKPYLYGMLKGVFGSLLEVGPHTQNCKEGGTSNRCCLVVLHSERVLGDCVLGDGGG